MWTPSDIGLVLAVVSGVSVAYRLVRLIQMSRCQGWPHVEGLVTWSSVAERSVDGPYGTDMGDKEYWPEVTYEYEVAGVKCEGARLFPVPSKKSHTKDSALEALAPFPVGARVPVYYHPSKPRKAVLDRGNPRPQSLWLGLSIALLVSGVVLTRL